MELGDLLAIVLRRWWIIALAVALTAASAVLFGELALPEYTATAEVAMVPSRPDLGLTQSAKFLLRQYMTVANTRAWAQSVIDELVYDMTPEELLSRVHFAAQDDRMLITIEVEDYDPTQARDVADAWADKLKNWRDQENAELRQEDRVSAVPLDQPIVAQSWPPSGFIMLAAGCLVGLVIAGVVILFVEFIEAGIYQTPQQLERQLGLSVLGAIPRSK
jgi:capsular polysaccharide biosynthesis protein